MRGWGPIAAFLYLSAISISAHAEEPADEAADGPAVAAVFDDICVRQAPSFRRTRSLMARHGLTSRSAGGAMGHPDGSMAAELDIRRGASPARRCSVIYSVPDPDGAIAAIEGIIERLFEEAWNRRSVDHSPGRTATAWTVLIDDTLGEIVHLPYSGTDNLGVMTIRF